MDAMGMIGAMGGNGYASSSYLRTQDPLERRQLSLGSSSLHFTFETVSTFPQVISPVTPGFGS